MGTGASAELVKGMAEAGKGTAEFVMSGERLQPKARREKEKEREREEICIYVYI